MERGLKPIYAVYLSGAIMAVILVILCIAINLITKKIILKLLTRYIAGTKYKWDDIMLNRQVFHRLALILPGVVVYNFAPVFQHYEVFIKRVTLTYIFIIAILVLNAVLDSINEIYQFYPISRVRPMKGLIQVVKIVIYIVAGIIIVANMMGQSPLALLSGIGALTAVFSLVFKDSILGFVAGIQLTSILMLSAGEILSGDRKVIILTEKGLSLGFSLEEISEMKKTGRGVKSIDLDKNDSVAFTTIVKASDETFLYNGKELSVKKVRNRKRGQKGQKAQL